MADLTVERFRALAGAKAPEGDTELLKASVAAANGFVNALPHADEFDPGNREYGTFLLALRLVRRAETPGGIASTDVGVAYVARFDPDVSRALGLGKRFNVG